MKGGIGNLMKQAQKLQADMQKAQEELANLEVEGQSGGGMVKVYMTGRHELRRVQIDPTLMSDDKEMLEDLVAAAVNDAVKRIEALRCLPGVGRKSAQRMAYHLLERAREPGRELSRVLDQALQRIGHCEVCRAFTEHPRCAICSDPARNDEQLCVVETPTDVQALEQSTGYRGRYFVLMGRLSPLDGMGPEELGLDRLERLLGDGRLQELIVATGATVEGEATAHYVAEMARAHSLRVMRIAHGVPLGGELEFVDGGTLSHAFARRHDF